MAQLIKRMYEPYTEWEEYYAGMWRNVSGETRSQYLYKAIEFTGDAKLYGSWMMKVITMWPKSCKHNLSDISLNRQAWIGHAACCLAISCPEDITRLAWHQLTKQQQDEANAEADKAIMQWERNHTGDSQLCLKLDLV